MPAPPRDFEKTLEERFPHLSIEWIADGWFLNRRVRNRYVLFELDRLGLRWDYLVIESPDGHFREPGKWVVDRIQRDDVSTSLHERYAKKKFIESLNGKDETARRTVARNKKWRDTWDSEVRDKAYFAGNQKRIHNRNKMEGVR